LPIRKTDSLRLITEIFLLFDVRWYPNTSGATVPRWILIAGGAALMFFGQILLVLIEWWTLGEPPAHPASFPQLSAEFQIILAVVVAPFLETIVGQWLPIRLVNGRFGQPWWVAGIASAIIFTCLHGYLDRRAINVMLGAWVLATVFIAEARRSGRPILSTSLTHALANGMVVALHSF
jgi:membrane protease YdiL (CAAX protease family)